MFGLSSTMREGCLHRCDRHGIRVTGDAGGAVSRDMGKMNMRDLCSSGLWFGRYFLFGGYTNIGDEEELRVNVWWRLLISAPGPMLIRVEASRGATA